jgi:hypothetical protein
VVAGAYRCPVCGIDFPTGAPHSLGAGTEHARAPEGSASPKEPKDLASRLKGALDQELGIGETEREPAAEPDAPATEPAEPHDPDLESETPDAEVPDDGIAPAAERRRTGTTTPAANLELAPARERPGPPARTERRREQPVATRRTPRRRSKSGSLALTMFVALLLIGAAGGGALWLDLSGRLDLGILEERLTEVLRATPQDMTVTAADGWVAVPQAEGPVTVTADGPFRVRIDGDVYSLEAGRTLRVPMGEGTRVEVRAVSAPTVATIRTSL